MNNIRSLFPPLFHETDSGGGGGSSEHVQVAELPEASFGEKNKIYQYVGSTTETLTNGYFYKCEESTSYDWEETTETETYTEVETLPTASAETIGTVYKYDDKYYTTVIVLSYSWVNIDVMDVPAPSSSGFDIGTTEVETGITYNGKKVYCKEYPASELTNFEINSSGTSANALANNDTTIDTLLHSKYIVRVGAQVYIISDNFSYNQTYGELIFHNNFYTTIASSSVTEKHFIVYYTKR